jgi:hypothetical protein
VACTVTGVIGWCCCSSWRLVSFPSQICTNKNYFILQIFW